ncbi:acyltransferase family protein [Geodermatophilus sp. SYSU D00703]
MTVIDTRERNVVRQVGTAREPFWDNVRFVAIALVVVGHSIEKLSDADLMAALYVAIYAFHMPLFAFVSGRFASDRIDRSAGRKLVTQLLVPYVAFSAIWFLVRLTVEEDATLDLTRPWSHLWFLLALAVWRLLLPVLAALRHPLAVAVAVAVVSGYFPGAGGSFDNGRILGMLPFFVLGWLVKERGRPGWWAGVLSRPTRRARLAAATVLVAAPVVAWLRVDDVREWQLRGFTQMQSNYVDLGVPEWWAGLVRLGLLGLAVLLGACVLVLVPRSASRVTRWGTATMYVYMLHLFPIYLLREQTGVLDWFDSAPRFALLVLLAVAWTCVLSTEPVRRGSRWLVEPRVPWLVRPAPTGSGNRAGARDS